VSDKKQSVIIGPWQLHYSENVYENPWLRLEHHEVTTPGNTPGIYGKVCFKNRAVGVIPVDEQGYTWLVGQYRYPLQAYSWEIPEGGCPLGSSAPAAALRELAEETGLRAAALHSLMTLHTSNSCTDEVAELYVARGLTLGESAPEPCEELEVRRLPLTEVIDMALSGEITDAISVAALLKLHALLLKYEGCWRTLLERLPPSEI